ncbi:MAG: deoxynucleoside kinase [Oscillospiraceae bacterium]|nr:deoxynucleoside kinase [Oscillospiraceae bacterium]
MAGKLIVVEGLDGSGKATQTQKLYEYLIGLNQQVLKITFPDYDSPASSLVKMYLNGELGDKPSDVNAYAASSFYAVDRVASYLKSWKKDYESGKTILCDRYATSNIIYQMSKMPQNQWDSFMDWQYDFEYDKLGLPAPNRVIYLDVEPEVSQKLMLKRYNGDESKMDLHEKNVDFLLSCRKSALYAADKLNWKVISCCENGEMKTIENIFQEILSSLKERQV